MVNIILNDYQRQKIDNHPDKVFYDVPKFSYHLDANFRYQLTKLYKETIEPKSKILDLMSSWVCHLPEDIKYSEIIGHGLNEEELSRNKILDSYWLQDLNINQKLSFIDNSFDVCLIVAGWQYLQYPEAISEELSRITKKGGKLIISFSNRAFWTKATRIWTESSDEQRIEYIAKVLAKNGWFLDRIIKSNEISNRILSMFSLQPDPFFSIISINSKNIKN
tara:strand:+ start:1009 stop:1671 length:663 start_codon:yes stop_codon:yes gene_type:complete